MPKIQPNFSEETGPIVPGTYLCKIISGELKTGRERGTQYMNWKLVTQDPPNLSVYYSTPIEGRGAGMFKHFVHCAGDPDYQGGEYDTDELIGQIVSMELDIEEYTTNRGNSAKKFRVVNIDSASLPALEALRAKQEAGEDVPF